MKFDGNLVWKQATATIAANRELVLALAGVFFFLPSFALIMLIKQPQVPPGSSPDQMMKVLEPFVATMLPWFLIGSVIQTVGQVTLLELFGRGGRSTVGEALRSGLGVLLSYVVMQLLTGFVMTSVLFMAGGLASLISPVIGLALGIYLVCQAYARFITAGAVIVLERHRNPFTALVRAVALTSGNGFRLGNFLFLLATAAFFILMVLTLVIGIVAALAIGEGHAADIISGFFSSAATAIAIAYFAAIIVAIYRQLAGDAPEQTRLPFD
jgi:hypothetical protein